MKIYFVIGGIIAVFLAGLFFGYKIKAAQLATCNAGLQTAISDNVISKATVSTLQKQLKGYDALSLKRLAEKDAIIAKLNSLLNLEVNKNVPKADTGINNGYLTALLQLFPQGSDTGSYCTDSSAKSPSGTANESGQLLCFTTYADAVTLIRNITLLQADAKDCRSIVSSLTQTK
jgi:hypothetical protein